MIHHKVPKSLVDSGISYKGDDFYRIVRFKAQRVVFGNHQIKGIDYMDTSKLVGKIDSLRILIVCGKSCLIKVQQSDVVIAFLNGEMEDAVYTVQVHGLQHPTVPNCVWKLNRWLYATKQAARQWQKHFSRTAAKFKPYPVDSDRAVYILTNAIGLLTIHLHVDDALIFSKSDLLLDQFQCVIHFNTS